MKMRLKKVSYTVLIIMFIILHGCSSDPEAPVLGGFIDSTYTPEAGGTFYFLDTLNNISRVHLPTAVGGSSSLLKLGWNAGIKFETLFLGFNFDSLTNYKGKIVSKVTLEFPVRSYPGAFGLKIGLYELEQPFSENDSLPSASTPTWSSEQIPDSLGPVDERILSPVSNAYSIDPDIVQNAIDGTGDLWENGIAVVLDEPPDSTGFYEINSTDLGEGPINLTVEFENDTTKAFFGVNRDYTMATYDSDDLALLGGVATRIHFEFDLAGINDSAIVHDAELVLNVEGSGGLGATAGELEFLDATTDFFYYLYSPDGSDPGYPSFWEGTPRNLGQFNPEVSGELRLRLQIGYIAGIINGDIINNGLVLQSDLEDARFQKALFYSGSVDSLRPRIEIIYSMPAKFDGEK